MSNFHGRSYQAMPATALLAASQAHLSLIMDLHPGWRPEPVRHELLRAAGQSATTTAMVLYSDLDCYADAVPYLALA